MNEEQTQVIDTNIVDKAINEQDKQVDPVKEPVKTDSLQETINSIKLDYENRIATQKAEADKAIKERDEVIKQLLNTGSTAPKLSIVDKINAKRNYKKW